MLKIKSMCPENGGTLKNATTPQKKNYLEKLNISFDMV